MQRSVSYALTGASIAILAACGGGSSPTDSSSLAPSTSTQSASSRMGSLALPSSGRTAVLDPRLARAKGEVVVWVSMTQPSVAAFQSTRMAALGADLQPRALAAPSRVRALSATEQIQRSELSAHRASLRATQDVMSAQLQGMGAKELARVQVAHNAVAIRVDAASLQTIALLPGVAKVRPVLQYQLDLSETTPYVGAIAAQASGKDGRGVKVAVLDSGIDYTHKNLGGPGTPAAYEAAYGTGTADPKNTTRDGLFPTAKVVGGYDFVGEDWPNSPEAPDEDPIDFEGHGTHVADIIAGRSLDGTHKGVAPGASLYAVKVCSAVATSCSGIALLQAMDFALDPDGDGDTRDAVDVINMSLGSSYGQIEDDLTLASANAVKLGVVVVTSAGNSANRPYIVGSPSTGVGVLSVAQTQVPSAVAIPLVITSPAAIAGTVANTATVDFAPVGSGFTGTVKLASAAIGTPGASNLACAALPAGSLAGFVALIDRGACAVSIKIHNAATAGAAGVLVANNAGGDPPTFSFGGPDPFTPAPTLILTQSDGARIKANIAAPVTVTVSAQFGIPLVGSLVASSSRGPAYSTQAIKPEIGAPGASLSAEVGTGDAQTVFGGTSGAAPMVSGAAALLVQAYPHRSPERIKALLMNSAETTIYTNPATGPGLLAPITRIGAGELRVDRALKLTSAAWNQQSKSAALSFGAHEVFEPLEVEKTLRIENYSHHDRTFTIVPSFRYANDEASGAVKVRAPARIRVPAHGHEHVVVKLAIDPVKLPAWALNGGALGGNGAALNGPEYDGYLTLTAGSEVLTVPWHVLPRKAARTEAELSDVESGKLKLTLRNSGAAAGDFDLFSLTGTSRRLPVDALPQPGDNFAAVDLRGVGVRYTQLDFGFGPEDYLEFAISTFGRRAHPNYPAEFDIDIDTDGDGIADYAAFNLELTGFGATGQNVISLISLKPGGGGQIAFFSDADLNSGNLIFTVPMNDSTGLFNIGVQPGQTIGFTVTAFDNYFTGLGTDQIANMRFTPGSARFDLGAEPFGSVAAKGRTKIELSTAKVAGNKSTEKGLLVMHRRNAGREASILRTDD